MRTKRMVLRAALFMVTVAGIVVTLNATAIGLRAKGAPTCNCTITADCMGGGWKCNSGTGCVPSGEPNNYARYCERSE